jgi:hypothetical protein
MGGVYRTDAGDYRQAERPRGYDLRRPQNTSTRQLSDALSKIGFRIGRQKVSELLAELGYSLQGNRKTKEGSSHPDRDKQFCFLNRRVKLFQRFGQGYFS